MERGRIRVRHVEMRGEGLLRKARVLRRVTAGWRSFIGRGGMTVTTRLFAGFSLLATSPGRAVMPTDGEGY